MKKIRVAAVNYLNTKPLLYGIKRSAIMNEIELIEEYPSRVAQMVLDGSADLGLIPVAIVPQLKESHIITDYCIGCDGAVASVCLFSDVPMGDVKTVYLDYQSYTSVLLAKILLKEYWKSDAELIETKGDEYRSEIKGTAAGLIIGDRALEQRLKSKYIYDLGEAWKAHTGLPFVFAAWVSNRELPAAFIAAFNEANGVGLEELDSIIKENDYPFFKLTKYFTECISYPFTQSKRQGLQAFFDRLKVYDK